MTPVAERRVALVQSTSNDVRHISKSANLFIIIALINQRKQRGI
jgi:hypothetical protein